MTDIVTRTPRLQEIAAAMEGFEASKSVANTGTGARREGHDFEDLVAEFWEVFEQALDDAGGDEFHSVAEGGCYKGWRVDGKVFYPPQDPHEPCPGANPRPEEWFRRRFKVKELVGAYPGEEVVIDEIAPEVGPFAGRDYPSIYQQDPENPYSRDLTTKFDGSFILEDDGVLARKGLLEYKTAKSSKGTSIDGNAHERLSFQIMQYLEVATQYPRCTLDVITNGAFVFYRNKYHVNFHVQGRRLKAFSWFAMNYRTSSSEYLDLVREIAGWLEV